jgi:hypothetical protein
MVYLKAMTQNKMEPQMNAAKRRSEIEFIRVHPCLPSGTARSSAVINFFSVFSVLSVALLSSTPAMADTWTFKKEFLPALVESVPDILKSQDKKTGRFGEGIFIVNDQHPIYPLAAAWSIKDSRNPWYHGAEVLEAIMSGGDALIAVQKPNGQWIFRKKDGSEWGDIYQPWTYSRWIRAFALVKDGMPADRRAKWEKALKLGFDGIVKVELIKPVQNIPCHDAMATWLAGKIFNRPDWCEAASAYMKKVVDAQDPNGFWTEHSGPVVGYNFVYVDAIGTYYGISGDKTVLPALERSSRFHSMMTYPDGSSVETVDERQPYHPGSLLPNVGFSFSPEGRAYIKRQYEMRKEHEKTPIGAEGAASFLLYGEEGEVAPAPDAGADRVAVLNDGNAMTRRVKPWFMCLSAYTAEISPKRWIQDRQDLLSVFHDKTGLIIGGGNTKLQPLWSTFTVGDAKLLFHKPGDEDPNFIPPPGILHVPTGAKLIAAENALALQYGSVPARVAVDFLDDTHARLVYRIDVVPQQPVEAHVILMPHLKNKWETASGQSGTLSNQPLQFSPAAAGAWFAHHGWRLSLPPQASVKWPVLPHNPYRKDGHAEADEGRIVVSLPFSKDNPRYELTLEIP